MNILTFMVTKIIDHAGNAMFFAIELFSQLCPRQGAFLYNQLQQVISPGFIMLVIDHDLYKIIVAAGPSALILCLLTFSGLRKLALRKPAYESVKNKMLFERSEFILFSERSMVFSEFRVSLDFLVRFSSRKNAFSAFMRAKENKTKTNRINELDLAGQEAGEASGKGKKDNI